MADNDGDLKIEWDDVEEIKRQRAKAKSQEKPEQMNATFEIGSTPLGMPVSGRNWKDRTVKKSSAKFVTPPSMHPSWEEKQKEKLRMDAVKAKEQERLAQKEKQKEVRFQDPFICLFPFLLFP